MKKFYLFLLLLISSVAIGQEDAWVYFTDKPEAEYYLSNPLEMLTQRALDRRAAQNIPLDILDVPIHQPYVDQIDAASGITVMAKSKWLNAVHVRGSVSNIQALGNLGFVSEVYFADRNLNQQGRIGSSARTPQARTTNQMVDFQYGSSANQIEMLNGHILHEMGYTGEGKIIAVLDAGFPGVNTVNPFKRIRDNNKILGGYNFVSNSTDIYTLDSHGTMVLSTMGGYVVNQLVGTAPDASYLLYVTEDVSSENPVEESYWVAAAEEADRMGADIINTSLGYFLYDDPDYSYTYDDINGMTSFASRGADIAFSRGMVVVVSAGNSGGSSEPYVGMPGDAINALTVGAVTGWGEYVGFSSIGPTADGRIKPDVMAKGYQATVAMPNGTITVANGTSFSGPIIAGMVATFWSAFPNLSNEEVVQYIKESSHLFSMPDDFMGYGIPDFLMAYQTVELSVEQQSESPFVVYPNPSSGNVTVDLPDNIMSADVYLYDSIGRSIYHTTVTDGASFDVSDIGSGVYLYSIKANGASSTGRLVKQ